MTECYVMAASRTPFGRYGGALSGVRPDDLAAASLRSLMGRVPQVPPARVGEVHLGNANGAGEENRNVARMAVLLAGLPTAVPASTINRLCGSGLDAIMVASRVIECGEQDFVIAGGVESMSRAPWVLPKPERPFPPGDTQAVSTTLGWRLVNPAMPRAWTVSLGEANEQLGARLGISRRRQDEFAERSHRLADAAWNSGFYQQLVDPVPGVDLTCDEGIRPSTTAELLSRLEPAFPTPDRRGTITAGNASQLSDGAAVTLLVSADAAASAGIAPLARIAGRGVHAVDPPDFGIAPVMATTRALRRAGITLADVAVVELNEAFAVQSLACIDAWLREGLRDPDLVNAKGGAIAMSHPLGASGGRVVATACARLRESGQRWAVATVCIGVGQALAIVLENQEASA